MEELHFPEFLWAYNWLYKESNAIYHRLAGYFGLSDTAFWLLYSLRETDRPLKQAELCSILCSSKQTVNSALKTLASRGLVELAPAAPGSRGKLVRLTSAGRSFSAERIVPAIEAEDRAFSSLSPAERAEFLRLAAAYTAAIDRELTSLVG